MSTITGPSGAGGALPPVSKTVAQIRKNLGGTLEDFTEVDGATLTDSSEVYLISQDSFKKNFKVILKATADAEGNNPLRAVPKDAFQTPVYVGATTVTITDSTVATQSGTSPALTVKAASFTGVTVTPATVTKVATGDVITFTAKADEGYNINGSKVSETFIYTAS